MKTSWPSWRKDWTINRLRSGKEELLRYADMGYFEMTPQLEELQAFVLNNMSKDAERVEHLLDDIQWACVQKSPMQELINQFDRHKIPFKTPVHAQRVISCWRKCTTTRECGPTPVIRWWS